MKPDDLARRLDPVDGWRLETTAARSDFDLNPGLMPPDLDPIQAAVLIVLTPGPQGVEVVLTRRADTLTRHTGQVAFPGGRLDPGETAVEAALREAWEEIGLVSGHVRVLGLGDRYRTGTGFLVTPVVGWVEVLPALTPAPAEVAEVFVASWAQLIDPVRRRRDHLDLEGQRRWFWSIDWHGRDVWGATAGMILSLAERFEDATEERAA